MWVLILILFVFTSVLAYYYFFVLMPRQKQVEDNANAANPAPEAKHDLPEPRVQSVRTRHHAADGIRFVDLDDQCRPNAAGVCHHWSQVETETEGQSRTHEQLAVLFQERNLPTPFPQPK